MPITDTRGNGTEEAGDLWRLGRGGDAAIERRE